MSPLAQKFADLRARGEKALVLFVTAGDPPLDELPAILEALVEGGADIIEVGKLDPPATPSCPTKPCLAVSRTTGSFCWWGNTTYRRANVPGATTDTGWSLKFFE